jgi:hypothetical protein
VVVVAHPADEERQAAGSVVIEGGDDLGDVERGLAEIDEAYGGHGQTLSAYRCPHERQAG